MWESMTVNNCNTYLIDGPTRVLIDPGHEHLFEHVLKGLENLDLSIEDIGLVICTHAHPDHIEAVKLFKNTPLKQGEFSINGLEFNVIHTPGHSPGSISLFMPEPKALFTGDVIFKEALGRTDLPGGSGKILKESIKQLSELEAEFLLSGHGEVVSENFDHVMRVWFNYI
ncbi:MAG: MBL fold metallo-hydrolase [Deltaproteobacteria bacterium]|nr:MBL fold metallo-hydrolase [Deltaproteobacteria bacterium]